MDCKDKLIYDICEGLMNENNIHLKEELEPLPSTCSPQLIILLSFFGTFLDLIKVCIVTTYYLNIY